MSEDFGDLSANLITSGGLQARRATAILLAIESRTAYLVHQSQQAVARYITPRTAEEEEQAFLSAVASGRELPNRPSIHDLDRYAPEWADLVPDNPAFKASLASLMGEKYAFTEAAVPRIRKALDLDSEVVRATFQRQRQQPLQSIYAPSLTAGQQIRWQWSRVARRLEELPPFWTAFSLTLTETVGASILALPIALALVGPIAGVIQLVILGLVNILTIAALSEAINRTGSMRYGTTYFRKLVSDNLGDGGALMFTLALFALNIFLLIAYYSGVARTLADATPIPAVVWAGLLFVIVFLFLRRETLKATIASALVIGFVNIGLILLLCLITVPYLKPEYLTSITLPTGGGGGFDPSVLQLIFGVIAAAFFGHTSAANSAKVVLRRDPSGKALLRGNVAALTTALVVYSLWVVVVNGSIAPDTLKHSSGTALSPLAALVGPGVHVLGSLFAVLAMGMGAIHFSFGTFFAIREALPAVTVPKSGGQQAARKRQRFLIAFAPVLLIFLLTEWLLWTHQESFVGLVGIVGVLVVPLLGGIFPALLLAASRRKGDLVPSASWGFLGNPVVLTILYLVFLVSILLHGLIIWDNPLQRAAALIASVIVMIFTASLFRRAAFARRTVIEFRYERELHERAFLSLTSAGQTQQPDFQVQYAGDAGWTDSTSSEIRRFAQLRGIRLKLPRQQVRELKIWLHTTSQGISRPIPAEVILERGGEPQHVPLGAGRDQVILPHDGASCTITILIQGTARAESGA